MLLSGLYDLCRHNDSATITDASGNSPTTATYRDLWARAWTLRGRLSDLGLQPGHVVGMIGANSLGWVVWDLALMLHGAVSKVFPADVPVGSVGQFVESNGLALLVSDRKFANAPHCAQLDDLELSHSPLAVRAAAPVLNDPDIHSLVYSSGSTGRLKGLVISRKGTDYLVRCFLDAFVPERQRHVHVMFLPLSSYQQRLTLYGCLYSGADLILVPYQKVFKLLPAYRPTFLIAPPVFYGTLLQLSRSGSPSYSLHGCLGGRIQFAITGMAPISIDTLRAFWDGGVRLLEVYGMNECGMISWNTERANKPGTVGLPIDKEHLRIDVDGEILVRRQHALSLGYFDADPAEKEATFRPDGTIATGDLGEFDGAGFLRLLGRKKDIVVLPNGQKFHPAEVEKVVLQVQGVKEAVMVYDELGKMLIAVVVPDGNVRVDASALKARILEKNIGLPMHKRFSEVLIHDTSLATDQRFMTRNMKLNRGAVHEVLVRSRHGTANAALGA